MNFLLDITQNDYGSNIMNQYGFAESALFGLQVLLIGISTVFAVLAIIWFALIGFKFIFHDLKRTTVKKDVKPAVVPSEPIVVAQPQEEEIIAVIAAAIAMAESEAPSGIKFRVVSFKKR